MKGTNFRGVIPIQIGEEVVESGPGGHYRRSVRVALRLKDRRSKTTLQASFCKTEV